MIQNGCFLGGCPSIGGNGWDQALFSQEGLRFVDAQEASNMSLGKAKDGSEHFVTGEEDSKFVSSGNSKAFCFLHCWCLAFLAVGAESCTHGGWLEYYSIAVLLAMSSKEAALIVFVQVVIIQRD